MARRRKSGGGSEKAQPPWLMTLSDLMTLIMTFFVLLLSLAVVDEHSRLEAVRSVSRVFGSGEQVFNPLGRDAENSIGEPGAMDGDEDDMAPMRDMVFDDAQKDLHFKENKYVQIFSINDQVLFRPGGTELSEQGVQLLDRILPYLQRIQHPLLVAGHTGTRRDEEAAGYLVNLEDNGMDSTWPTSYARALAVYRHLRLRGIEPGRLSLEAFGQFHPRYSNNTPDGRRKNRRVDLVLDKRNLEWIKKVEDLRQREAPQQETYYRGFRFDLDVPGRGPGRQPGTPLPDTVPPESTGLDRLAPVLPPGDAQPGGGR